MAVPFGTRRRATGRSPSDDAWVPGALLGTVCGTVAIAFLVRPAPAVVCVVGLAFAAAAMTPGGWGERPARTGRRGGVRSGAGAPVEVEPPGFQPIPTVRRIPRPAEERPAQHTAPRPADALAALVRGQELEARGDVEGAVAAYGTAAAGDGSIGATASLSLGVLLDSRGDCDGARRAYRQAAASDGPASRSAALLLGWLDARRDRAA